MAFYLLFAALIVVLVLVTYFNAKTPQPTHTVSVPEKKEQLEYDYVSPDWAKNAVIYQVNVRQFSQEGTFAAFQRDLPRIKALGVDVLWLMPIFPICEAEKKCDADSTTPCWGSPYAPYDFEEVHPGYGTKDDFRALVAAVHAEGMKIILDFVPNHTGFDSKWMQEHPEWYVRKDGVVQPVTSDQGEIWADIAQFDLKNPELREAWMQVHEYWVREFDIDGYREDCAWAIAADWWMELRQRLDQIKDVYMLAEDEVHGGEQFAVCFETNYGWGTHHFMKQIAAGKMPATALHEHTERYKKEHGTKGWQMNFTQNHDENTWHGTETDLFGAGADAFTALCFSIEGTGLIYNGQENGLNKRLSFFNKDEIDWSQPSRADFFKALVDLKHRNVALWNGQHGGALQKIDTSDDAKVYAFFRAKGAYKFTGIFNLSPERVSVDLKGTFFAGDYTDVLAQTPRALAGNDVVELAPYAFHLLSNR